MTGLMVPGWFPEGLSVQWLSVQGKLFIKRVQGKPVRKKSVQENSA
ncbi:hypothetical protein [Vibrio aerogenes]|nr:hypothetical protein [Vibrio aerogenes]